MATKTCIHTDFARKLETNINTAVTNNTSNSEILLALSIGVNGVGNDLYNNFVSNTGGLPNLQSCSIGSTFLTFNDEIKQPVISRSCAWLGLDGKTLRSDADTTCNVLLFHGCSQAGMSAQGFQTTAKGPFFVQEFTKSSWKDVHLRRTTVHAIKTDGSLWSWGCGANGILGDNGTTNSSSPVREITSSTWTKVSGGRGFTNGIKSDGSIWSWGCGTNGRLGNGSTASTSSPVRESCLSTTWCRLAAGCAHNIALKTDGSLWGWGYAYIGTLGLGCASGSCLTCSRSPVRECTLGTSWCAISASFYNSFGIKTDGSLWAWGARVGGALSGACAPPGNGVDFPVRECTSGTSWCFVAGAPLGVNAIKTDGSLWSWGTGSYNTLAMPTNLAAQLSPIRECLNDTSWRFVNCSNIDSGYSHGIIAIKKDGSLWTKSEYFGCNMSAMNLRASNENSTFTREYTCSNDWVCGMRGQFASFVGIKTRLPSTTILRAPQEICGANILAAQCIGWLGGEVINN